MNKTLFLFFLLTVPFCAFAQEEIAIAPFLPAQEKSAPPNAPITVQYPSENMKMSRGAKAIMLFGQVNLPQPVTLQINGSSVPVHTNGAFITHMPVQTGGTFPFLLKAESQGTVYQALRHVVIPGADIALFTDTARFDEEEVFPQHTVALLPGDTVNLYVRGTPGAEVTAYLPGLKNGKNIPLQEAANNPGTYRAKFIIDPGQKPKETKISYRLKFAPDRSKAKVTAPAKLQVWNPEKLKQASITVPGTKLRKLPTATGNLYPYYRAYGTVLVSGEKNSQYRLVLNDRQTAWLEKTNLQLTGPADYQPNLLSALRMQVQQNKTQLVFEGTRPVPFRIEEQKDRLEVTLYYSQLPEENFSFDATSPLVDHIGWTQPAPDTLAFTIYFKPGQTPWGHDYRFDANRLEVDLIHPPLITPTAKKPLLGARIVIDAGHSPKRSIPYDGAVGPTGYLEYEATLALANDLKPLLETLGATVILTRQGNNHMTLPDRQEKALQENAHIFISLHYNALPDTADPLEAPRGYSVYYAYPHSLELAQAVYQSFVRSVPLADNGLIHNDVLFIPRMPQLPSILVENAYIIMPQQEEMLRTPQGRAPLVHALYEGILKFYKATPPPAKKPARTLYMHAPKPPVMSAAKK